MDRVNNLIPLPRSFFQRPARELGPRLLGCHLVAGEVVIRITEVEAYEGHTDPGSHAYGGPTRRNATMFGEAGHLYVYRHMGLHSCCNIVASTLEHANGCLVRAGEVVRGAGVARARRNAAGVTRRDTDLAQGPGRMTVALGISWLDDGLDLCDPDSGIFVADRIGPAPETVAGPRIGLRPEATDPEHLWLRFHIPGDPTVSGPRSLRGRPGPSGTPRG
ncbi:DNA-3-methyladenine glycosylase [Tessaracoccus rhinocerotis]|uniref:Putative 3-methyladenine DNA glycosylase n=1 Tax=Tessaracoccus rhinocerotis TaxID=1689449 RepID=A0A553K6F5_9ACTN|nr:DNA-3-methyladenine glycosylase [Tessaracoccus rhinocerotis]